MALTTTLPSGQSNAVILLQLVCGEASVDSSLLDSPVAAGGPQSAAGGDAEGVADGGGGYGGGLGGDEGVG